MFCPVDGARLGVGPSASLAPAPAPPDPMIGRVLAGRYRILRRIGEGGMGIVYEAEHIVIEKRVGLKVLREDFSSRPDVVERFRQEAKSASRIGHENIIDISDFGTTDGGAHFFVMELLHGRDLAEELSQKGPLSPERAVSIVSTCARALGAAHEKGIIHRDMKPENIFLCARGGGEDFVKIVDFGIAKMNDVSGAPGPKLTKTGMIFGTPEYMSPEQAGAKHLDERVDIYALGVILFELLTGRVPFTGDSFMGIITAHMLDPVPPLHSVNPKCTAGPALEAIVMRAMAKVPADRYQSMAELLRDLSHLGTLSNQVALRSSGPPVPGTVTHHGSHVPSAPVYPSPAGLPRPQLNLSLPTPPPGDTMRVSSGRRSAVWGVAGAALAVVGVLGGYGLMGRSRPAAPPPQLPAEVANSAGAPSTPVTSPVSLAADSVQTSGPGAVQPSEAKLTVELDPPEASLTVDGRPACVGSPCTFLAPLGATAHLRASHAGHRATDLSVLVSADGQSVRLKLPKKRAGSSGHGELMDVPELRDAWGRQ
jgi:serine/threonine protein kinase